MTLPHDKHKFCVTKLGNVTVTHTWAQSQGVSWTSAKNNTENHFADFAAFVLKKYILPRVKINLVALNSKWSGKILGNFVHESDRCKLPIVMRMYRINVIIKFSTSVNAFLVLWLVLSISAISSYTLVWRNLAIDCAKRC